MQFDGPIRRGVALLVATLSLFTLILPTYAQSNHPIQTIESDDPRVVQGGTWSTQSAEYASSGSYLFSSGVEEDVLALAFVGSAIEVVYLAGPQFDTLAIEIDGTVVRTVITTSDTVVYGQAARIDYLSDEPHSLKVYAQTGGVIAVDAFHITPILSNDVASGGEVNPAQSDEGGAHASTCAPLNETHRVSLTSVGTQADGDSGLHSISYDGRFVAFDTSAALAPGDYDGNDDVYVFDRQTCAVELISVSSTGVKSDTSASDPWISGDGRFVVFTSSSNVLVPADVNGLNDVFLRDRQMGTTIRVSGAMGGVDGDGSSSTAYISPNGRYIAFQSTSTNLVPGDTNNVTDTFVYDRVDLTTIRVSSAAGGIEATGGGSGNPSISNDGRYVVFESSATNLVPDDTNNLLDVFVRDLQMDTTVRVSVGPSGIQSMGGVSIDSKMSADGRSVIFSSFATNLVVDDTNSRQDVFVHDLTTNTTTRVSVATGGVQATGGVSRVPQMSADGRYIAFMSTAANLGPDDVNGTWDVFVHDRQTNTTTRIASSVGGTQSAAATFFPCVSGDGNYISFIGEGDDLVPGDTNGARDIFVTPRRQPNTVHTLALFNPAYEQVNLLDTLADNPAAENFTAFSSYTPASGPGLWVMGDWNADGLDTPGLYRNGVFYFTNVSGESLSADWGGFWIGVNGPPVAGRFSNAAANDCIGAVDSVPSGNVTIFALYYTCDLSGMNPTPPLSFQWLSAPLPDPTFTGTH